jgi:hypothetical protein
VLGFFFQVPRNARRPREAGDLGTWKPGDVLPVSAKSGQIALLRLLTFVRSPSPAAPSQVLDLSDAGYSE